MDAPATRKRHVSCLALTFFYDYLESHGRSRLEIQEGLPYPPAWLDDRLNWIDYATFLRIEQRLAERFPDTEELFYQIGRTFAATKGLGFTRVVVRGLLTPHQVYGRIPTLVSGFLFPFVKISFDELPGGVRGTYVFDADFPPSPAFLDTVRGILTGVPQIMGAPQASVTLTRPGTHTAVFDVRITQWTGLTARIRGWFGALRAAPRRTLQNISETASELEEANRLLQEKVAALTDAKAELDAKVGALTLLNSVAQATSGHLELRPLVTGACRAIAAGRDTAVAILLAEGEPPGLVLVSHSGVPPLEQRELRALANPAAPITLLLASRAADDEGRTPRIVRVGGRSWMAATLSLEARLVGVLLLGTEGPPIDAPLLQSVASQLAVAVENARSYRVIAELRDHLEVRVRERTAELEEARTSLQDTVLQLEQADRVKADFFTYISHDLRTPLQLIIGPLDDMEWQLSSGRSAEILGNLQQARNNAVTLRQLVDELLDFARLDSGRLTIERLDVDLVSLAADVADTLRPLAERRDIHLASELPTTAVPVVGDAGLLRRVVVNLLGNALKYVRPKDNVTLRIYTSGDEALLEVADTGPGIAPADQHRIFERFTRGENADPRGGSGIGLAMARDIVRAHEGTLELDSRPGSGATFRIRLALGTAELPAPALAAAPAPVPRVADAMVADAPAVEMGTLAVLPSEHGHPRHRVLIAEDNEEMRAFLVRILEREHHVRAVHDGLEALAEVRREPPDIVVSDVMMPGLDGLSLCRTLKADLATRGIPVILVSARHGGEAVLGAFAAGADDYLTKPFSPPELTARVHAQLRIRTLATALLRMEKQYSLGILSSGLAHEMLNPVNAVVNAVPPLRRNVERLSLDLESRDGLQVAALLDAIEASGHRMHTVIKGLLAYTRQDESPKPRAGRLSEEVEAVLTILRYRLIDVAVDRQFTWDEPILHYPEWIDQILMNLLANALDAMPGGGRIVIGLHRVEDHVHIRVHDSGPGVATAVRSHIFTPFFTTKPPGKGTGLGLAIAREIAALHRGTLDLDATVGPGACFIVRLPIERSHTILEAG